LSGITGPTGDPGQPGFTGPAGNTGSTGWFPLRLLQENGHWKLIETISECRDNHVHIEIFMAKT